VLTDAKAISVVSAMLPPHPLRYVDGKVQAFDPLTEQVFWSTDAVRDDSFGLQAAYDGKRIVVTNLASNAIAFDPDTGEVQWDVTVPGGYPFSEPIFLDDGTLLIQQWATDDDDDVRPEGHTLAAIDPASGEIFWTAEGYLAEWYYWDSPNFEATVAHDGLLLITSVDTVARLMPKARPNSTPLPTDAPACPSGEPVSWVQYVDGSVLICGADSEYSVTSSIEADATSLAFNSDGYTVGYVGRLQIKVTYGSDYVEITDDQGTLSSRVITSWAPWTLS